MDYWPRVATLTKQKAGTGPKMSTYVKWGPEGVTWSSLQEILTSELRAPHFNYSLKQSFVHKPVLSMCQHIPDSVFLQGLLRPFKIWDFDFTIRF